MVGSLDQVIKSCINCSFVYRNEKELYDKGSRFRLDDTGNLWFNCVCQSTLVIPKIKAGFFSPADVMHDSASIIFHTFPEFKKLPHLSNTVMELQQVLKDPNVSSKQIAHLVRKAPLIADQILKIANNMKISGLATEITSLEHAVTFVGMNVIEDIITTASLRAFSTSCQVFDLDKFWQNAYLVGRIAEQLTYEFKAKTLVVPFEAYIAGCLANIGKVVLAICFPDRADELVTVMSKPHQFCSWNVAEAQLGVLSHTLLGEIGASFWGLPDYVIDVIRRHHDVVSYKNGLSIVDLVGFAVQLAHWIGIDPAGVDSKYLTEISGKFGFHDEQSLDKYVESIMYLKNA
jgi:HD-like signal output (HDOD) protein